MNVDILESLVRFILEALVTVLIDEDFWLGVVLLAFLYVWRESINQKGSNNGETS